jgi:[ribosomal protein S5]-alanine N-acetyltransferase
MPAARAAQHNVRHKTGHLRNRMSRSLPDTIETERLILRAYRFEDVSDVLAYADDEEWGRYLEVVPYPYKRNDAERFLARQVLLNRIEHASWAVIYEGAVVGGINIRFWFDHVLGEMGWSISRSLWNRGLMTEAGKAVLDAAFSTYPSLRRVRAVADARNGASHRVMEKLGMTREGTLRQNRLVKGGLIDDVWFGILRPEWEELRKQ